MKAISTKKAPAAIGPYSQAIQVGNLVYTSGQIPIDPATGAFVEGGIKEQTRQSLTNVKAILEEVGLTMNNGLSPKSRLKTFFILQRNVYLCTHET